METSVHLGERDCSLQRRNQKIIEETALRLCLTDRAAPKNGAKPPTVQLVAKKIGYENCGTIEYLVDDDGQLLFHGDEHPDSSGASHH